MLCCLVVFVFSFFGFYVSALQGKQTPTTTQTNINTEKQNTRARHREVKQRRLELETKGRTPALRHFVFNLWFVVFVFWVLFWFRVCCSGVSWVLVLRRVCPTTAHSAQFYVGRRQPQLSPRALAVRCLWFVSLPACVHKLTVQSSHHRFGALLQFPT